jgi:hypothetical protein
MFPGTGMPNSDKVCYKHMILAKNQGPIIQMDFSPRYTSLLIMNCATLHGIFLLLRPYHGKHGRAESPSGTPDYNIECSGQAVVKMRM